MSECDLSIRHGCYMSNEGIRPECHIAICWVFSRSWPEHILWPTWHGSLVTQNGLVPREWFKNSYQGKPAKMIIRWYTQFVINAFLTRVVIFGKLVTKTSVTNKKRVGFSWDGTKLFLVNGKNLISRQSNKATHCLYFGQKRGKVFLRTR